MSSILGVLSERFDEEIVAQYISEYGLDISGDEHLLNDSIEIAKDKLVCLEGSLNTYNQLLSDGIWIDFDDYEHDTDAKWFMGAYIEAARQILFEEKGDL